MRLADWAFTAGVVGGALIVVGALVGPAMMVLMMGGGSFPQPMMRGMGGATGDWIPSAALAMGAWGLIMGGLVLVAALRVRARPDEALPWGVIMIVAGSLSLLAMGGFLVGAVAAVAGGALAVAARAPAR